MIRKIKNSKELGLFIKDARLDQGMTQGDFAKKIGMEVKRVSRLENGHQLTQFEAIIDILGKLGLEIQVGTPDSLENKVEHDEDYDILEDLDFEVDKKVKQRMRK